MIGQTDGRAEGPTNRP